MSQEALTREDAGGGGILHVLRVAFPLVLASSGHAVRIFVDRVMLSRYSPETLAASLPAGLAGFVLMSLFLGTAGYAGTFVSQYVGAGQQRRAGAIIWQGLYISLLGAVVVLLVSLKADRLFGWMGHPPAVQVEQVRYFRMLAVFTFPSLALSTINGFWGGRGRTSVVMGLELFCAALNVALNAIFIFGHLGMPRMGIVGAALATGLSSTAGAVIAGFLFFSKRNVRDFNTWPRRTFDPSLLWRLVKFGLPNGMQFFLDMLAFNLFVAFMGRLGMVQLAAAGMAFGLNALAFLPIIGLGMAAGIFVGQGVGAGDIAFAKRAVRNALAIALMYSSVLVICFVGFPNVTLAAYASGEEQTAALAMARISLRFVASYLIFDAVAILMSHAIKAAGDTRFALVAGIAMSWGTMVLPTFIALRMNASVWVMWSILVGHVALAAVVYLARYLAGQWQHMSVLDEEPPILAEIDIHVDRVL